MFVHFLLCIYLFEESVKELFQILSSINNRNIYSSIYIYIFVFVYIFTNLAKSMADIYVCNVLICIPSLPSSWEFVHLIDILA